MILKEKKSAFAKKWTLKFDLLHLKPHWTGDRPNQNRTNRHE